MKRGRRSDVHSSAQFVFQIGDETAGEKWRAARSALNQKVKVAGRARFVAREGAENPHIRDAVTGGDGQNGVPFLSAQFVESRRVTGLTSETLPRRPLPG